MHDRSRAVRDGAINVDALLNRGFSESEARQILGENMIRLFKDVWNE